MLFPMIRYLNKLPIKSKIKSIFAFGSSTSMIGAAAEGIHTYYEFTIANFAKILTKEDTSQHLDNLIFCNLKG